MTENTRHSSEEGKQDLKKCAKNMQKKKTDKTLRVVD